MAKDSKIMEQRDILIHYLVRNINMQQKEVAALLGLTPMAVNQILKKTIRKSPRKLLKRRNRQSEKGRVNNLVRGGFGNLEEGANQTTCFLSNVSV